eukprot:9486429-Pyramimonas_sp.AAC.1
MGNATLAGTNLYQVRTPEASLQHLQHKTSTSQDKSEYTTQGIYNTRQDKTSTTQCIYNGDPRRIYHTRHGMSH